MSRRDKFFVNVCLTGIVATKGKNSQVPCTPEEVARDVAACTELGATIFHIHARDALGLPDWRRERYSEFLAAAREAAPRAVLCVSTSGRRVTDVDKRTACLRAEPAPDMASLTLGSVDWIHDATMNPPDDVLAMATAMKALGIRPELEVFDLGMARAVERLVNEGVVESPSYVNVILGNAGSADLSLLDLAAVTSRLHGTFWCVGGIGKAQISANAAGIVFGHGVRVGLEDNLYRGPEKTAATNEEHVRQVVEMGRILGKTPYSVAETRKLLGL